MDYFSIIKRLGLFQPPSEKVQSPRNLPPLSMPSIKLSPSTKLLDIKPSVYKNSSPTPTKNEGLRRKSPSIKILNANPPKIRYISHQNSPRYSAVSRGNKNRNVKPPIIANKNKPTCEIDELSGISAWSKTSSFMNSRF